MKTEDIILLYQYNDWANKRILETAEKLTLDQLTAANDLGWGSLRGALTHMLSAETRWRQFLNAEGETDERWGERRFGNIAALRERWRRENEALWDYLHALRDVDLYGSVTRQRGDRQYRLLLWQCLVHVVNHGTQHRAECAALLTGFGHSPGDMDFTVFLNSRA